MRGARALNDEDFPFLEETDDFDGALSFSYGFSLFYPETSTNVGPRGSEEKLHYHLAYELRWDKRNSRPTSVFGVGSKQQTDAL